MCGINGAFERSASVVAAMNHVTMHRGPDQTGVSAEHGIAIGNNRLAILDVSEAGRQPMTSADGKFTIVFNGEIFNYRALRAELESRGVRFRGHSDTEVVVEGYAHWGRAVVDRLRGMWAIAVRHNDTRELFLSRDPFGIKPLYVYDHDGYVAFSSEIKGLLAHPRVPRVMDPQAVRDVMLLGYVVAPRTILQNVTALLPGEERLLSLETNRRSSRIRKWEATKREAPTDEELLHTLKQSVEAHLIADVPVGLFFSGGLDSTLLAALLREIGHPLTAFHVAMEGRGDTKYAREIAKRLSLSVRELILQPQDMANAFNAWWTSMDQPLADTSVLPTLLVSKQAASEVKVVLSGEGGDELFGGYARHARLSGLGLDLSHLVRSSAVDAGARFSLRAMPSLAALLPRFQGARRALNAWSHDAIGLFLAETALSGGLIDESSMKRTIADRLRAREVPDGVLAMDRLIYLPDDLLMKLDVTTMAASLEGRVPFLDREVFAAVGGAPMSWKRGEASKVPVRRLLKRWLPTELVDRPKGGFSLPLSSYLWKHEGAAIWDSVRWYQQQFAGLAPTMDRVLTWGMSSATKREQLARVLGHGLFAIHTVRKFSERLSV